MAAQKDKLNNIMGRDGMEDIDGRIAYLERRVRILSLSFFVVFILFVMLLSYGGGRGMGTSAQAQQGGGYIIQPANVPTAIEASSFILKDREGNVRGMWTAEGTGTTFATAFRKQLPAIVLKVDDKGAFINLSDNHNGKISLGLKESEGESYFEMGGRELSRIGIISKEVLLETLGERSNLVVASSSGDFISIEVDGILGSKISFIDSRDYENVSIEYVNGESSIKLISPAIKGMQEIKAAPGELQSSSEEGKTKVIKLPHKN